MTDPRLRKGLWQGQPAYVIGGGSSLKSFDWDLLRGLPNIIAINAAIKTCPTGALWFSEDLRSVELYSKVKEWRAFVGIKVFHALKPDFAKKALTLDPSIEIIDRTRQDKFWSRTFSDGLALSSNSGVGAINLAWLLGADPICLLGFDCKGGNFHTDYERAGFEQTSQAQYESFRSDFDTWVAPHCRDRKILNLVPNPDSSAIVSWPKINREEYLASGREPRRVEQTAAV